MLIVIYFINKLLEKATNHQRGFIMALTLLDVQGNPLQICQHQTLLSHFLLSSIWKITHMPQKPPLNQQRKTLELQLKPSLLNRQLFQQRKVSLYMYEKSDMQQLRSHFKMLCSRCKMCLTADNLFNISSGSDKVVQIMFENHSTNINDINIFAYDN